MKKYLLTLTTLALLLCEACFTGGGSIFANDSGSCGTGVTWTYTTSNKKLTISGSGAMNDYTKSSSQTTAPWKNYVGDIKSITIANTITKIGNYAFYKCANCTTVTYTSTSTVATIGDYAYAECTSLTSITVPTTVTSIGTYAYYNCSSAKSLTMNNKAGISMTIGSNAFKACGFNGSITIPAKVTSIGMDAFYNCTSLQKVTFNASSPLTTIGTYLFEGCSSLTSVTLPPLLTELPANTFRGCTSLTTVTIPAAVTTVANTAFYGCTNLTTIHAMPDAAPTVSSAWSNITPASITLQLYSSAAKTSYSGNDKWSGFNISTKKSGTCGTSAEWELDFENGKLSITGSGDMADYTSSSLAPWAADTAYVRSISIAKTITKIGNYAFYKHARCTSVSFVSTSTVSAIGEYAFKGCTGLTSISLPTSLLTIGQYAFESCTGLTSISLPSKVTSVGNYAYSGCSNATSLTIGNNSGSSRTIGDYAFQNCSKVTSITIPTCVTAIGQYVFNGCSNATTLTFNSTSKVATIGGYAFKGCEKITSVTIPASVTSIGNEVFWNCLALKTATFDAASTLTSIGTWTFDQCSALTTVTLPPLLESIPGNTFNGCSALEILVLPATIASITSSSFTKCSSLKTIIANRSTHPTLSGAVTSLTNFTPANVRVAVFSNAAKLDYSGDTYWSAFDIDTKIEGECGASGDNIKYALDLATGVLTLTGSGAMATYSTSDRAPWYQYRSIITSVEVGSGITGIGAYAFKDCANITTASLPASLTSIGSSAFDGCSASTFTSYSYAGTIAQWVGITFSGTYSNPMNYVKKCFVGGSTEVNDLVIPNGTTTISAYAFYNCLGLTSATLPASLTSIDNYAFSTCSNIASVNYLGTIDEWCSITFGTSASNPTIFCGSLQIDEVEQTEIYLSDDLEEIKNYAFYNNTALTEISIKNTTSMAANSLYGCTADLMVRGEVSGDINTGLHWALLDGVLTISKVSGEGEMTDFTSGTAPWYPYRSTIRKIVVEEGVTKIGKYAFQSITNTCGVYLPASLTTINDYGFYMSSGISYIVSAKTSAPTIIDRQTGYSSYSSDAFNSVSTTTPIFVPDGSTTTYSTAQTYSHNTSSGWKRFSNFLPYTGTCGATGNEDNVIWTFDPADNSITISGTGAMYDYNNATAAPWNTLKSTIAAVVIEDGVTKGGKYAFANCTALTDISLASSCTSFGTYAFSGCTALTEVELPEGITTTGSWMFHGCTNLVDVTLPSTLTEVDVRTFSQTGITSIDIPEGVTNLDNYSFYQCASLASIDLPSTLTRISSNAFEGCSSLASIDLPEGLTNIGSKAFAGCSELASITIPRSVTTISTSSGSYTFNGCSKLRTVNWNAEVCADFNKYNSGSGFSYYTPFGDAKTTITVINFGSNVRIIPSCLCQGMTGITSVTLPASMEQIHQDAFNGCTGLTSITIPANVTTIQSTAFEGCTDIDEIIAYPETMPTMGTDVWNNVPISATVTVYCPATETAYKENANWSRFTGTWEYVYGACDEELDADTDMSTLAAAGYRGDLTVKDGTLTMDDISARDVEINNLTVQPGARIELADDASYTIDNLILQRSGTSSTDEVATASIQGSLTAENLILDFELDDSRWFAISLPKTIAANSVTDAESGTALTPDVDYYALYFDGEARANDGYSATGSHWKWVTSGNLNAGQGYLIGLPDGSGTKTLRFTMADYTFDETADKNVAVSEYASWDATNAGWNLVGNPYLQAYHHSSGSMAVEDKTLTAMVTMSISGANISYNTPMVDEAIIPPFSAVFVQAPVDGSLSFEASSARKGMRARYAENKESEYRFLDITLTGNGGSDHTSFIVGNYSDDYSIGADMVKWFNDAYATQAAPTLYSFKWDHKEAVNARSEQRLSDIPLGYHATLAGVYTFALSGDYPAFEHIWLYDQEQSTVTDLKMIDYEFYTEAGTQDARFTITAELPATGQGGATDITGNEGMSNESLNSKFIRNNRLFIRKGDKLYTVMGQETK